MTEIRGTATGLLKLGSPPGVTPTRFRLIEHLTRLLVLILCLLLPAARASAAPLPNAQTRVAAIEHPTGQFVGPHTSVLAVQGRERAPSYDQHATGSSVAAEGEAGLSIGAQREIAVADQTGGTIQGEPGGMGLKIVEPGVGSTDVDVIGPNGEYIQVNGPGEVNNLSKLGSSLRILQYAADEAGVQPQAWFAEGTSESVLNFARARLGEGNVFTFNEPGS